MIITFYLNLFCAKIQNNSNKLSILKLYFIKVDLLTENDFESLSHVFMDQNNMQYYPYIFDEDKIKKWIFKNKERYQIFGFGLWAVILKETGEVIGDCGLTMQLINGEIKPEIGYHIRKDQQQKGYECSGLFDAADTGQ